MLTHRFSFFYARYRRRRRAKKYSYSLDTVRKCNCYKAYVVTHFWYTLSHLRAPHTHTYLIHWYFSKKKSKTNDQRRRYFSIPPICMKIFWFSSTNRIRSEERRTGCVNCNKYFCKIFPQKKILNTRPQICTDIDWKGIHWREMGSTIKFATTTTKTRKSVCKSERSDSLYR